MGTFRGRRLGLGLLVREGLSGSLPYGALLFLAAARSGLQQRLLFPHVHVLLLGTGSAKRLGLLVGTVYSRLCFR